MAKITGTTGNDSLSNGTTGADQFFTGSGGDYVQATAGSDSYNLGYASSTSYWRYGFNDYDTLDYRYAWSSAGLANSSSLKITVDLELGTIKKFSSTGTLLSTDTVIGVDAIYGTQAADTISGRNFWDSENFRGEGGNDTINGRGNEDSADYSDALAAGITVNMAAGTVTSTDVDIGTDTLREIEGVTGTKFNDLYDATGYGGSSTNRNSFGSDYNFYSPLAGDDTIKGNGQTIVVYGGVGGAITVNLGLETAVGTVADIVTGFVDDAGSSNYAPGTLKASGVYFIIAGNYNDVLTGGGKVNTLGFSTGYTVSGDASFEMFRGQGGDDLIDGKTGFDRADFRQKALATEGLSVNLASGVVTGDPLLVGTDTLRGIESVRGTFLDDVYDARGFTLSNAISGKSVNNGDCIVYVPPGETLTSTAFNEFQAIAGNDSVTGNGATRVSFDSMFITQLTGTSIIATFTSASSGTADYGLTDGGYGKVTFSGAFSVRGGYGNDAITGTAGFQNLQGFYGNDTIKGGDGADQVYGYNGGDTLALNKTTLYTDNDSLDGGAGNDLMRGDFGNDTLLGGSGNDSLDGGTGNDSLVGGAGNDLYTVDSLSDVISETTTTATEIDSVSSSIAWTLGSYLENLTLTGSGAVNGTGNTLSNTITGNTGNNSLNGSSGNDTLSGGEGNDNLYGGTGNDSLIGGAGNDVYTVDSPTDTISETSTIATEVDSVSSAVTWTLGANLEKLTLTGSTAINGTGNGLANTITGNTGNNLLDGATGMDTLSGGTGLDIFRFSSSLSASSNADTINSFVVLDDTIQVENSIFVKLTTLGVLSDLFFKSNTTGTAGDSNDYIVYESDTGKLFYDADGNGLGASVLFATLTGAPVLTSADIFVT